MVDIAQVDQLEAELAEAKANDLGSSDPEAYRDLKLRLVEARRSWREAELASGNRPAEGMPAPETVSGSAGVNGQGGE